MALANHQNPEVESFISLRLEFEGGSRREPMANVVLRRGTLEATGVRGGVLVDAGRRLHGRRGVKALVPIIFHRLVKVLRARRVHITIDLNGRRFQGHATHTDVVVASALALSAR